MSRSAVWFTVAAVALLAAIAVLVLTRPLVPFDQPGTTWEWNAVTARDSVRLLDSGRYVKSAWCDICPPSRSRGKWREITAGYELSPDSGKSPVLLRRLKYGDCVVLEIDGFAQHRSPAMFYYRKGEAGECMDRFYEMLSKSGNADFLDHPD